MTVDPFFVWLLQDVETGAEHVFSVEHLALHAAEQIVGNCSCAEVPGATDVGPALLYGPGDGTTRVMIRKFRRAEALQMGLDILPL